MDGRRPNGIIIHYHEIALKGENRPLFVRTLARNIRRATEGLGLDAILAPRGRIILCIKDDADIETLIERLRWTFGIANFSPVWRSPTDPSALQETIAGLIDGKTFSSFRITARRADKKYPIDSMDLNRRLGRFVQDRTQARVDLEEPDLTIFAEILEQEALVYLEKRRGPGGLPVGVAGRVACLISGGIDSPVAAYLMMKRGCTVSFIHFHSHPYLSKASIEKAEELVSLLTRHQFRSRLFAVPLGEIQRQIVLGVPPPLRVVLYRRFMLRIAEELAQVERAKALVTGESLGQVASQTLDNLIAIQEAAHLPILRPLIGLDKEEIVQFAQRIGTYPISIQPDQDCCRLFIPPHPSVRARLEEVRKAESRIDLHGLVKMGLEGVERKEFHL
jgi:thiamine biosynthesis protein ThiI